MKEEKNIGMAVVAYIIFFIPLLTDAKKDPFVKFHVKQGLVIFICGMLIYVASMFLPFPLSMLAGLLQLCLFVLVIIGILSAVKGEEKPLPIIGQFADQFKF